jgi:C4-dicarboxylate-specific signal transduction histidine kinase
MPRHRFQLDTRILTIFFLVAMPFVAVGAYVVVGMAESALSNTVSDGLEQRALETRVQLERYVARQQVLLRLVTSDPAVVEALWSPAPPVGEAERDRLVAAWADGDPELLDRIVGSSLANRLRRVTEIQPAIRLLQVVGGHGLVVGSSSRAGSFYYADHDWFRAFASEPLADQIQVGDVERRHDSTLALFHLAWPVRDGEGTFLGAVRAVLDARDLDAVLAPVRVGETGHALLLRGRDGMILGGDDTAGVLEARYPGYSQLQAAMAENHASWLVTEQTEASADGGERLVAPARFAAFSRVSQIPDVDWLVLVQQDYEEAMAPVHDVRTYLWLHFAGAFGTAILLGLYFSFRLELPVIEEDLHLHEEHVPPSSSQPEEA